MTGLRLVPGGTPPPPAAEQATTAAPPPPANPRPAGRGRCECGVLPHRCWCADKPAYDRDYAKHVAAAERALGLPR